MTTTLSHRDSLIQVYSDFHKDAYGFRPRGINYDAMTTVELEADLARFAAVCEEARIAEKAAAHNAVAAFDSSIKKLMQIGASDEATALRWMAEAGVEDSGWDVDYYLWKVGISKYEEITRPIYDKFLPYWQEALKK